MKSSRNTDKRLPHENPCDRPGMPLRGSQPSLPFSYSNNQTRRTKSINVIRLGNPAIPVKVTEFGTYLAKFEHVWQAARRYAKRNGYKIVETYGVIGVAPFQDHAVVAWFTYLEVPYTQPVELYQLNEEESSWVAEWTIA